MPYADANGISLHYQDAGPAGAPIVLLLHELGGSGDSWAATIPLLTPSRRAIAVDCRGAGRSEKPTEPFTLEQMADDLAALIAVLDAGPVDVIGAALGSLLGVLLASRHPAAVRRLAMFAAADDMDGQTAAYVSERAARVRSLGMRAVVDTSLANAFPDAFAAARAAYRPIWLANDPACYAAMSLALALARFPDPVWASVRAPTLVVSGAHDFIWPPALGRRTAARIAGARFEVLTEAGHFPHLQTPESVVSLAHRFFSGDSVL